MKKKAVAATAGSVATDPVTVVPDIESDTLLIHEENDNVVSWEEALELFKVLRDPANETWNVDSAAHSQPLREYPVEHVGCLNGFFCRTLTKESGVKRVPYC